MTSTVNATVTAAADLVANVMFTRAGAIGECAMDSVGSAGEGSCRRSGSAAGAGTLFATMGALGLTPPRGATPTTPFTPPRPSDFHLTGRTAKSVVILGGGIAGLTAAYELGKAGYHCTILEARGRTGGRNFTVRAVRSRPTSTAITQRARFSDGIYMNAGPARLAQWMVTLDYCRELGVPIEVFTNQNADAYIYNENSGATPVRYRTAKADVYGYVSELLAKATDQGALDAVMTADDKSRLLSFLQGWGATGAKADGFAYTGGSNRGYASYPTAWDDSGTPLPGQHPCRTCSPARSGATSASSSCSTRRC